jgi:hypothetical protein
MRKRVLKLLGLLAAIAVAGFLLLIWITPVPRLTEETFEQIKGGMSEEQVVALLQVPGSKSVYWAQAGGSDIVVASYGDRTGEGQWKEWANGGQAILIRFDRGKVGWVAQFKYSESLFDKVRRWLRLGGSP